jgi:flagellar biosynthesis protein FlhB
VIKIANPIGQVIASIASLIVLLIAYTIFGPMIDGVLSGLVYDAISTGTGTALDVNAGSLILTMKIILMGIKIFAFFVIFAILGRLFIYLGFFTEERGVY